jgi:hypothetical protein
MIFPENQEKGKVDVWFKSGPSPAELTVEAENPMDSWRASAQGRCAERIA